MSCNVCIKLKSVKHYLSIMAVLMEYHYNHVAGWGEFDSDELELRRYSKKQFKKQGYLCLNTQTKLVLLFHRSSPLRFTPRVGNLKDLRNLLERLEFNVNS